MIKRKPPVETSRIPARRRLEGDSTFTAAEEQKCNEDDPASALRHAAIVRDTAHMMRSHRVTSERSAHQAPRLKQPVKNGLLRSLAGIGAVTSVPYDRGVPG